MSQRNNNISHVIEQNKFVHLHLVTVMLRYFITMTTKACIILLFDHDSLSDIRLITDTNMAHTKYYICNIIYLACCNCFCDTVLYQFGCVIPTIGSNDTIIIIENYSI